MNEEPNKNIPIIFQHISNYQSDENDIRFREVKIWLMHLEENLNGSYFSRKVVEDAIPTLANTPILAFIEKDENGELDFSDHRVTVEKKNGKLSYKYLGKAIGVIPENNNACFEERVCDDGKVRTFLTVKGLLWSKFDDPVDIMNRDISKSQSMELAENYEGEFRDDNLFHFTKFSFYGACGLGWDVEPAMKNASIELQFSYEDFRKEVNEKLNEFKIIFSRNDKVDVNEDLDAFNYNEEESEVVPKSKKDVAALFSLTVNQLYDELFRELRKEKFETENWYGEKIEASRYSLIDFDESYIYAKDYKEGYIDVKIPYSKTGDDVSFNFKDKKRIKWSPTDWDGQEEELEVENYALKIIEDGKAEFSKLIGEKNALKENLTEKANALLEISEKFSALEETISEKEQQIEKLQDFKKQIEEQERESKIEDLFSKYSKHLTKEDVESLREKEKGFESYEDFEKEVKLFVADKIAEDVSKERATFNKMGIPVENNDDEEVSDVWARLSKN